MRATTSSLLFLVRLLAVVDVLLLFFALLHCTRSTSYFSSLETQVALERKNRIKWETYLNKVPDASFETRQSRDADGDVGAVSGGDGEVSSGTEVREVQAVPGEEEE